MAKLQSSLDLPANVLFSLSKDVYTQGKEEAINGYAAIAESGESAEKQHLLHTSEKKHKGVSWLMTSFLIVNTALGVGILNFPAAYDQAGGVYYATVLQLVMLVLMMTTMFILAYCSDVNGDSTYHDVLLSMCGKVGQQLAALSITITLYCVCVASLIIIGDQMDSLFHSLYGAEFCALWYLERRFTISIISIFLILPVCFFKRVDFLVGVGTIGIFAMIYPVFLTIYGFFKYDLKPDNIKTRPENLSAMFAVMPVLGLGYQCQEVVVPIYACMKERNLCNFAKSSFLAMGFLFIMYSTIGCFGYLTFGATVSHNIMKMYDANDPFVMVGVGALIIKMIATYPILALCGRDAASGIYAELRGLKPAQFKATENQRRYVFAAIWFSTSLVLAVFTSGIGIVIKYLGSVASANIFIYPGICLLRVVIKEDPGFQLWKSKLLVALSIFLTAFGGFCIGVILLQTILTNTVETTVQLC